VTADRFSRLNGTRSYQLMLNPADPYGLQRQIPAVPDSSPEQLHYSFNQVPPGRYRVKLYGSIGYTASVQAGGTDLLREPLVVAIGSAPPEIEIVVKDDVGSVSGELVASTEKKDGSRALSGMMAHPVYFFPVSGNGVRNTAWASPDGKFS